MVEKMNNKKIKSKPKKNKIVEKQKSGKEIVELYNKLNKVGFTPEEGMLYLLVHMQKIKAKVIAMDLTDPTGKTMTVSLQINGALGESELEDIPKTKNKYWVPTVM